MNRGNSDFLDNYDGVKFEDYENWNFGMKIFVGKRVGFKKFLDWIENQPKCPTLDEMKKWELDLGIELKLRN